MDLTAKISGSVRWFPFSVSFYAAHNITAKE